MPLWLRWLLHWHNTTLIQHNIWYNLITQQNKALNALNVIHVLRFNLLFRCRSRLSIWWWWWYAIHKQNDQIKQAMPMKWEMGVGGWFHRIALFYVKNTQKICFNVLEIRNLLIQLLSNLEKSLWLVLDSQCTESGM